MPGVFKDTAAFVVGQDSGGNAIMQLVDAAGTLLQWVPAVSNQISIVTVPMVVNHKRLIGRDAAGNPVFQMLDDDEHLLQWTENKGQTDYIVAPFYVGALVESAAGGGVVAVTVTDTTPENTSSRVSPYFDATHRSVGWGPDGKEYFIQIDEAGRVINYASDGTNLRDLGAATMNAAATAADLSKNYARTNPRLTSGANGNGGGGNNGNSGGGGGGGGSGGNSSGKILLAAGAAVLIWKLAS